MKRKRNQTADDGRERGEGGGEAQLKPKERRRMIETDATKGKVALGNGRTWKRKKENAVLTRTVG